MYNFKALMDLDITINKYFYDGKSGLSQQMRNKPDEIELFKLDKSNKLKHHYVSKFKELKSEYQRLMEDISMNERIYQSSYNFQPIVGQIYYLYKKENDNEFLSIISPIEWNNRYQLIGSYQLQTDGRWNEKKLGT